MKPEAALHLEKADKLVESSKRLMAAGFINDAARSAYLAAFHAAQAFLVEQAGRAAKTHSGAHSQFGQLALHELGINEQMALFLPRAFRLKALVDYEFGPDADLPADRVAGVVEEGADFVSAIARLLAAPAPKG